MPNNKEKRCSLPFIFSLFLLFITISVIPGQAADNEAKGSVAVLPFEMHAPGSMAYLQDGLRDMLASRLAANAGAKVIDRNQINALLPEPGTILQDQPAINLGSQLGADYVITGSLTSLGTSMSLDAKVLSVASTSEPMSFYASATKEGELINAINQLSWDIAEKVFGSKRPASAIQTTSIQSVPKSVPKDDDKGMASYKTEHPEKAFMTGTGTAGVPLIMPKAIAGRVDFTKTQNVEYPIYGMDMGDVDGDGQLDVVLSSRDKVYMYHLNERRLLEFGSVKMPARSRIHSVSVADMDENGKAEIYISANDETSPHSWAYEWDGTEFNIILEDVAWYIRTVQMPGEGLILAGQRGGNDTLVRVGIFRLMRNGTKLQPQERLVMPNYVNLFDFTMADVTGDGNIEIVGISRADRMYIVRSDGSQLWVSDNYYSGTRRYIGEAYEQFERVGMDVDSTPSYDVIGREGSGKRIYIPSRMIVMDINQDGKDDIIVNRNVSTASRVIENFKRYKTGEIHALTWNGIGMTEIWQTKKIDGYIPDFQFLSMPDQENIVRLYVGLILRTEGWSGALRGGDSTILMYDVELAGEKNKENQEKQ
jgi:TolB-like protein